MQLFSLSHMLLNPFVCVCISWKWFCSQILFCSLKSFSALPATIPLSINSLGTSFEKLFALTITWNLPRGSYRPFLMTVKILTLGYTAFISRFLSRIAFMVVGPIRNGPTCTSQQRSSAAPPHGIALGRPPTSSLTVLSVGLTSTR